MSKQALRFDEALFIAFVGLVVFVITAIAGWIFAPFSNLYFEFALPSAMAAIICIVIASVIESITTSHRIQEFINMFLVFGFTGGVVYLTFGWVILKVISADIPVVVIALGYCLMSVLSAIIVAISDSVLN